MKESHKARRVSKEGAAKKRAKRESQGVAWGDKYCQRIVAGMTFLEES